LQNALTPIITIDNPKENADKVFDLLDVSDTTRADYKYHIGLFLEFIQQNGINRNSFLDFKRTLANRNDFSVSTLFYTWQLSPGTLESAIHILVQRRLDASSFDSRRNSLHDRGYMLSMTLDKYSAFRLSPLLAVLLLYTSAGCKARLAGSTYADEEAVMAQLVIALQRGFVDDLVVVRVNDQEVFRKEGVKTKLLLGYADSFEAQAPEGPANVEVILPTRDLAETIVLQLTKVVYLGLSIHDGRIDHRISHEPFGSLWEKTLYVNTKLLNG
jgi:hypothetical protein